jgi:hypothetical protein
MVAGGQGGKRGFSTDRSTVDPAKLTLEEFEKFAGIIKKLLSDSGLKWAIIGAGVGGIAETIHLVWLAARYVFKF